MENINLDELAREFVSMHEDCKDKIYGNACKLFKDIKDLNTCNKIIGLVEDIDILIGFEMFNALFACIFSGYIKR